MLHIYDKDGRITQTSASHAPEFLASLDQQGIPYFVFGTDGSEAYIDTSTKPPTPRMRPSITEDFDTLELEPLQIATHPNIPKGQLQINGPSQNGVVSHPGGPLPIQFIIPGTYLVAIEAFPYRRREFKFSVTLRTRAAS